MTDRATNQKLNWTAEGIRMADDMKSIRNKARSVVDSWFGKSLQNGGLNDLNPAVDFQGTAYEGMSEEVIHNFVGSLVALETWFQTHGENFERMRD